MDLPLSETTAIEHLELLPGGAAVLLARSGTGWLALPSRDGGRTWEEGRPVPIPTPALGPGENRPSFVDHDHWALADGSKLHVTSDAGRTWRDVAASLPAGVTVLDDLWLTAGGQGWATGNYAGDVLHTTDGGVHGTLSRIAGLGAGA